MTLVRGGLACAVVAAAGCYQTPNACGLACATTCPDGFTCSAAHTCMPDDGSACPLPQIDFAAIALGADSMCGLDTAGGLYCWGDNSVHQLGVVSPASSLSVPTRVGDASTTWSAFAVGPDHVCALQHGMPWCWGQNQDGESNPTTGGTIMPTAVGFGPGDVPPMFTQIASGGAASCALGSGQLWCWGSSDAIGDGGVDTSHPIKIGTTDDWTAVALGVDHGCAIETGGGVSCWGGNGNGEAGQLGNGPYLTPQAVALSGPAIQIVAGDAMTCAIVSRGDSKQGELWCWGFNLFHQIADVDGDQPAPVQIGNAATWSAVAVGSHRLCGIVNGVAYCWGAEEGLGGLGDGFWARGNVLYADATALGPADAISLGTRALGGATDEFGCLMTGTTVACWGENSNGELTLGGAAVAPTPVEVSPPSGHTWTDLAVGNQHACATTEDHVLHCWGADDAGEVTASDGLGTDQPCLAGRCDQLRPVAAPAPIDTVDDVVTGQAYTCARSGSAVHCWGTYDNGELGVAGATTHHVQSVAGQYTRLVGGDRATCGFTDATGSPAALQCWGLIADAPVATPSPPASDVSELAQLSDLQFGDTFACATRMSDMARVCWGANGSFELGDGTQTDQTDPVAADAGMIAHVAANAQHACALTTAGGIECWGSSTSGESGQDGGTVPTPRAIHDAHGALQSCSLVTVTWNRGCAICAGTPLCWGANFGGQLGRGTQDNNNDPQAAPVLVPPGTYAQLALGDYSGCALDTAGHLYCWGDGNRGQLGTGVGARNLPTPLGSP